MEDYKKQTIKSYDKHAKKFSEKFKGLMNFKRRKEFQKFIELIPENKILDLGCGGGDNAVYFSKQGLDVTCIDLSEKMIELCKRKNLNAQVMDIENLEFKNNSFDGIWAITSLLHIPKLKLPCVISKLHNILKDKGILYVCVKEGDGEKFIEDGNSFRRFFVFWKKEEFLKHFENKFQLIGFKRTPLGKQVFLEFFFKKSNSGKTFSF